MQVLITENDRRARTITSFLLKPNQTKNLVTYHSKKVTETDFFSHYLEHKFLQKVLSWDFKKDGTKEI